MQSGLFCILLPKKYKEIKISQNYLTDSDSDDMGVKGCQNFDKIANTFYGQSLNLPYERHYNPPLLVYRVGRAIKKTKISY